MFENCKPVSYKLFKLKALAENENIILVKPLCIFRTQK